MALDEWGGTPSPVVIFGQVYAWTREVIFHWLVKNPQYNPTSDPILAGETYAGALEPGVAAAIVSLEYGLWQLDRCVPSGADVAGTGVLGLAILAGSDGKARPKDTYAFGNRAGPRPPRAGVDVSPNADGMLSLQAPPFPEDASAFANPDNAPLTGHYHRLLSGSELPQGLDVVAGGLDVNVASYQPVTNHTIFNTVEMAFDRFVDLFSSLAWQYGGRK